MEQTATAFDGPVRIAQGSLGVVAQAVRGATGDGGRPLIVFDDATGRVIDIPIYDAEPATEIQPRGPGRPRLGVVAREVTLLPRHWDWLAAQPGGASVTLRRLVDESRRSGREADRERRDIAYRAMSALAGDFAGFEEASRALFAGDRQRLAVQMARWPVDVRDYILARYDPEARLP